MVYMDVFISYSWDGQEHEDKVMGLTNYLRENGFTAKIDRILSQEETATDFDKMMHFAITSNEKVIIVLSRGYKEKAEAFRGGVGNEYSLIIKDLQSNPQKYILGSFDGRGTEIVPLALRSRDVVDLNKTDEYDRLYRKLLGVAEYAFSDVGPKMPQVLPKPTPSFKPKAEEKGRATMPVIKGAVAIPGATSRSGGLYRFADFSFAVEIANEGPGTLTDYQVELSFPKDLFPDYSERMVRDGFVIITSENNGKLFKGQTVRLTPQLVKIAAWNILRLIHTEILVKIYSEAGTVERTFSVKEVFFLGQDYGRPHLPLSSDLFTT
jgi:hypothetical protein